MESFLPIIDKVGPDQYMEARRAFPEVRMLLRIYAMRPVGCSFARLRLYLGFSFVMTTTAVKRLLRSNLIRAEKEGSRKTYKLTEKGLYTVETLLKVAASSPNFEETIPN